MISTYGIIVYESKSILYVHRRSTKSRPHAGYKLLLTIACASYILIINEKEFIFPSSAGLSMGFSLRMGF